MEKYKQIQTENNYLKLLKSGMFFEFHPELTGNWKEDKKIILNSNTIKINKIIPPKVSVYSPDNHFLGIANEYEFLDIRVQIKRAQISGYYVKFFEHKVLIDKNGNLDKKKERLLDIMSNYYMELI